MRDRRNRRDREGVALIVVLFIVMAVTVACFSVARMSVRNTGRAPTGCK
ncbi:MAG: hypothetical protein ACYSTJ_01230 [Planctomycetota bacterium]